MIEIPLDRIILALLTISVTEDEIDGIGGENIAGAFACMKYFQSLDNANNKAFVPAFKKMWGEKTVDRKSVV